MWGLKVWSGFSGSGLGLGLGLKGPGFRHLIPKPELPSQSAEQSPSCDHRGRRNVGTPRELL